jgi:hypothetical protein
MGKLSSSAVSLLFFCVVFGDARAQSFDAGDPITIGELRIGQTLEEVRVALPDAEWQQDTERNLLGRRTMRASRALNVLDGLYDLTVEQGEGTDYQLLLTRDAQVGALDDCRRMGIDLIETLEARFGQFRQSVTVPDFRRACFDSAEMFCTRRSATLITNGGSEMRVLAKNAEGRLFYHDDFSDRRIRVLALGAEKAFGPHYDETIPRQTVYVGARYEAGSCRLSVQIERSSVGF